MREPEIRFLDINGLSIRTSLWRAKGTTHPPILFCNGIGANLELVQLFAEQVPDRDVLTFDVPGVGQSDAPRFPYRLWQLTGLVRKVVSAYAYLEVDVIGLSWGGTLAQQLSIQYPRLVRKTVLAATIAGFTMVPGKLSSLSKMTHFKRYSDQDYLNEHFEDLYGDPLGSAGRQYISSVEAPSVRGYLYQVLALLGWTSLPFLPLLKQPVLAITGSNDLVVPHVNSRILAMATNNSEYALVEGAGHLFMFTESDVVVPEILRFLDGAQITNRLQASRPILQQKYMSG